MITFKLIERTAGNPDFSISRNGFSYRPIVITHFSLIYNYNIIRNAMKKLLLIVVLLISACAQPQPERVRIGAEQFFDEYLDLVEDKTVALITNHTGLLPDGRHIADAMFEHPSVQIVLLFGPEHGIRGDADHAVDHGTDERTGLPVYSLYGDVRKPTPEMLENIDVIVFDIQDVGARFYTYISTMNNAMEAAAEQGKKFIVFDRPNPITGLYVDGTITDPEFRSFVGIQPIPVAHGMTVGELATMFNEEGWLENGIKADLTVIKAENYTRDMWYDQTGLPWIKPSPNMLSLNTAIVYTGTCFLEGINVSEGRGTEYPFEYLGAPWVDAEQLATALNAYALPGVTFEPVQYTPGEMVDGIRIYPPKYVGETVNGVYLNITDRNTFEPVKAGVYILHTLASLYPDQFQWRESRMDNLWGTDLVRMMISEGKTPEDIIGSWQTDLVRFMSVREKHLLYR
jgi:uncharacterized protein YbbC (DUF1343 family)